MICLFQYIGPVGAEKLRPAGRENRTCATARITSTVQNKRVLQSKLAITAGFYIERENGITSFTKSNRQYRYWPQIRLSVLSLAR